MHPAFSRFHSSLFTSALGPKSQLQSRTSSMAQQPIRWLVNSIAVSLALVVVAGFVLFPTESAAQTLVGDAFTTPYSNWVDAFPARGSNWRLSFDAPSLIDANNANPPTSGATTNDG